MFKNTVNLNKNLPFKNIKEAETRNIQEKIYDSMGNMKRKPSA